MPTDSTAATHAVQPAPWVPLGHLDALWLQLTGTLCNLTCTHCFISCSPKNDTFGFMPSEQVQAAVAAAVRHGVKEFYFTGGEPFLHPDCVPLLCQTLAHGPVTVLTNGTVFKDSWLKSLAIRERQSDYSLEFRVSMDGFDAASNDAIRGPGSFDRAMRGLRQLLQHGFLPLITAAQVWEDRESPQVIDGFLQLLRRQGYSRPRLNILPRLQIGAEAQRTRGYALTERVTPEMLQGYDMRQLVCHTSRTVTDRGVWVCPLLLDHPQARLAGSLEEAGAFAPYAIDRGACFTCYQHGAICSNPSARLKPGTG